MRKDQEVDCLAGVCYYGYRLISIDDENIASPLKYEKCVAHDYEIQNYDFVDDDDEVNLVSCKKSPLLKINWVDTTEIGTRNLFTDKYTSEEMNGPKIDLNNMKKYPAIGFVNDR